MGSRPTLKTISKLTGLAVPTVSRALNDAPDIGEATKIRVRETAVRIGYVPNRAGVRLRTGKTNVISLVLSTEHDMMNFTARLISSVAAALRQTPYHLIVTPHSPNENVMVPIRYIVDTRSADAVILNQIQPEDRRVAFLRERGFPFVTHGRSVWSQDHPFVDFDNTAFGRIAVERLIAKGRRNILIVAPPHMHTYASHMIAGAREAAKKAGVEFSVCEFVSSDSPISHVHTAIAAAVTGKLPIDGIVCGSTNAAMGAVAGVEAEGLLVGKDVDIVAKEAVPFLQLFRPSLLSVEEDVGTAGRRLAEAAIQAIERPKDPPVQLLMYPDD